MSHNTLTKMSSETILLCVYTWFSWLDLNSILCMEHRNKLVKDAVEALSPYIEKKARRFSFVGLTREDIFQEGLIGLVFAVQGYKKENGAPFNAYAMRCIDNNINSAIRNHFKSGNRCLSDYYELSEGDTPIELKDTPEEIFISRERIDDLMRKIKDNLSTLEKNVLALHVDGYSYSAISKRININKKAVDNALQRARKKLRGN